MISKLYKQFPEEKSYRTYATNYKWTSKIICPFCGSTQNTLIQDTFKYHCNKCNTNHSLTSSTIMHNTKIDIRKWIIALYLMLTDTKLSYRKLANYIEVDKKTAYRILKMLNYLYNKKKLEVIRISGLPMETIEILTLILLIRIDERGSLV